MSDHSSGEESSSDEPKRYALHWYEDMRPDEEDLLVETVGDE